MVVLSKRSWKNLIGFAGCSIYTSILYKYTSSPAWGEATVPCFASACICLLVTLTRWLFHVAQQPVPAFSPWLGDCLMYLFSSASSPPWQDNCHHIEPVEGGQGWGLPPWMTNNSMCSSRLHLPLLRHLMYGAVSGCPLHPPLNPACSLTMTWGCKYVNWARLLLPMSWWSVLTVS